MINHLCSVPLFYVATVSTKNIFIQVCFYLTLFRNKNFMVFLGPLIYYNIFKHSYLMYKLQSIFQYTTKIFIKMVFWCKQSLANFRQRFFQILLKCGFFFFFLSFFFIDKNDTCEKWNAFWSKGFLYEEIHHSMKIRATCLLFVCNIINWCRNFKNTLQ